MELTNYPRGFASMGVPVLGAPGLFSNGKSFFVDPTNGNDGRDGQSVESAFKTLTRAYAKLTANRNEVVYLIGNASSISLSATLTWAKAYTHLVGICAPVNVGQRARIFQTATATGVSPMIDVTATGCSFRNLYLFHGVDDATSKICFRIGAARTYLENVHLAGIGHATMDVANASSLAFAAGASECLIRGCSIGVDTIGSGANGTEIDFVAGAAASRITFEDCLIYRWITAAGHALVTVRDGTAIDRFIRFRRCLFLTESENHGTTATSVFSIPAGIAQGYIILDPDCNMLTDGASGSGDWDSNNRGILFNGGVAPAAAAAGGVCTKQ